MAVKIFVATKVVERNRRDGADEPVVIVLDEGNTQHFVYGVELLGPSRVVSVSQKAPGPHIWIETRGEVRLLTEREARR